MTKITLRTFESCEIIELTFEKDGKEYYIFDDVEQIIDYYWYDRNDDTYLCIDDASENNVKQLKDVAKENGAVLRVEIFDAPAKTYIVFNDATMGTIGHIKTAYLEESRYFGEADNGIAYEMFLDDLRAELIKLIPEDSDEILNGDWSYEGEHYEYHRKTGERIITSRKN